jgi:uncharacterized protein (TIGR03435 family)
VKSLATTVSALLFAVLAAQAQDAKRLEFEVATVRRSSPDTILESFVPTLNAAPGTTLRLANRQLKEIIMIAYGIGGRQLDGPPWLVTPRGAVADVLRFDIVAKVPVYAKRDDVPAMLQNLLADRFKVRVHQEQRQITMYALELSKAGLTVKPVAQGEQSGCRRSLFGENGITTATCQSMTTKELAQQLQTLSPAYFPDGPVVDTTGLTGVYDFTLQWITQQQRAEGQEGPSMLDAIDKLGLHIDHRKGAAEVLVVDQADQTPTEN